MEVSDNPRLSDDAINTFTSPDSSAAAPRSSVQVPEGDRAVGKETVSDASAPDWGRDDAFLWAGQAAMKLKDYPAARDYFAKALDTNPDNNWVRHVLLPGAEKALAAKAGEKSKS